MSVVKRSAPTEEELAIQKKCILAGYWPTDAPTAVAHALGAEQPTPGRLEAIIDRRRQTNPEEFLSSYDAREASRGPEAGRFVKMYKAVLKTRDKRGGLERRQARMMRTK